MDWYEINYLYPQALERFSTVMFPNTGIPSLSLLEFYDIKKLYSFFDKQGIYMTVEMIHKSAWVFTITTDKGQTCAVCSGTKTMREDIEIEGFNECFAILEKKIRNVYI